ncbi:GDP-fucose protein O-fucosyltransferase 2 [Tribolium castaneum]|uniref:GDP-fucose protein O-fucosyltransferase 2 n=1 Tax=Tribolium castaneum TaxID=7070 RepID=D6WRI8_TRICA|nr:PREDICTED: GDP-fucose protein O-fucosyltransferase 2 [Tribolium castaneum]EFA07652.2 GDP-fucose protein O-fucosyltransferase 2-like Protein [Tribolium castaneum]|eukprot:XP_008195198.1 PREDICTED: GDP-fucose protein O-fucosyltransferase 2 [Tribolium castaneum]
MSTQNCLFEFILLVFFAFCNCSQDYCHIDSDCGPNYGSKDRYLLYDVNPPEGFNLRRDVYMRFAILAYKLKQSKKDELNNFKLVLPPWSRLFHWKYNAEPEHIPWGRFFDLESLKRFAPVIEMYEFFDAINQTYGVKIDEVYVLQHFKDMFETGNFKDRMQIEQCAQKYQINYFFYKNVTSNNVKCLSYHGPATKLSQLLLKSSAKTILLDHAEVALHDMFGDRTYWQCRRSMRFNKDLQKIALDFRQKYLNSSDEFLPENWEDEKPKRSTKGGPYLGVHLRRRDFLRGRAHQVPSINSITQQITNLLEKLNLSQVFIATDADEDEYRDIIKNIPFKTQRYTPDSETREKIKDGGVAIIDQIICSHARYFIGTYESTFSFRIQEEREILGFPPDTTFNCFCKENTECPQPTRWKIVY